MAARHKKLSGLYRLLIIAAVLGALQGAIIFFFSREEKPVAIRDAIVRAVEERQDLDKERRELLKVQLALANYKAAEKKYPNSLEQLVPTYLDSVPRDPQTSQPIKYQIVDGRYRLGEPKKAQPQADEGVTTVALLTDVPESDFIYDPTKKRDPFEPFDLTVRVADSTGKTPLERYSIGSLKLTAVLDGFDQPAAIVENSAGKGFTIRKGTKIGPNGGEVVEILPDRVLVLETSVDFTGQKHSQTHEMRLRTEDQEAASRQ